MIFFPCMSFFLLEILRLPASLLQLPRIKWYFENVWLLRQKEWPKLKVAVTFAQHDSDHFEKGEWFKKTNSCQEFNPRATCRLCVKLTYSQVNVPREEKTWHQNRTYFIYSFTSAKLGTQERKENNLLQNF